MIPDEFLQEEGKLREIYVSQGFQMERSLLTFQAQLQQTFGNSGLLPLGRKVFSLQDSPGNDDFSPGVPQVERNPFESGQGLGKENSSANHVSPYGNVFQLAKVGWGTAPGFEGNIRNLSSPYDVKDRLQDINLPGQAESDFPHRRHIDLSSGDFQADVRCSRVDQNLSGKSDPGIFQAQFGERKVNLIILPAESTVQGFSLQDPLLLSLLKSQIRGRTLDFTLEGLALVHLQAYPQIPP